MGLKSLQNLQRHLKKYFDDFRMSDWELLNELLDGDYFQDIGFSYGSFANGNLSTDFAIPVWNHFSDLNLDDVFDDLIISIALSIFSKAIDRPTRI